LSSPPRPDRLWVPGTLSLGVKRPGCEADHSLSSSAEVKECVEPCPHSPNTPSWRGAQFKKCRDHFTFTLQACGVAPRVSVAKTENPFFTCSWLSVKLIKSFVKFRDCKALIALACKRCFAKNL